MKKAIIAVVLALTLGIASANAQGHGGHGFYHGGRTVIVSGGYYSPYYSFGAFGPYYGYPYYGYQGVPAQPSKLDMEIAGIRNDYAEKIESVRMDNTLTGKEKRAQVREFKKERDDAIFDAKRNYYKQ